jgi:hypothetical protein
MADSDMNEINQAEKSLLYIEEQFLGINKKEGELKLFKQDLNDLKNKFDKFMEKK